MPKRKVNNLLALAVLSYLTQRPMHAYELQRNLKDNDAARTFKLSYGSLYAVVKKLADAGFIEEHETARDGKLPERTVYRLTTTGAEEMRDWLRELISEPRQEHPAFAAALSLIIVLPPDDVVALLAGRLNRLEAEDKQIQQTRDETIAAGVHPIFLIEDDYRLALLRAEVTFIRTFIDTITASGPGSEWAASWRAHHADVHADADGVQSSGEQP